MRLLLLFVASAAAFAPARRPRPPSPLSAQKLEGEAKQAMKLEGEAKQAMSEVRAAMGSTYDFGDWARVRADFPSLAPLSDEDLRAAVVAPGDPLDILVGTPLLPILVANLAILAARSQGVLLCGTFLADRSCPVV